MRAEIFLQAGKNFGKKLFFVPFRGSVVLLLVGVCSAFWNQKETLRTHSFEIFILRIWLGHYWPSAFYSAVHILRFNSSGLSRIVYKNVLACLQYLFYTRIWRICIFFSMYKYRNWRIILKIVSIIFKEHMITFLRINEVF